MSDLRELARPFPQSLIADNPSGYGSYVPHGIYKQKLLLTLGGYDFELVEILRGTVKGHEELGTVVVGVVMRLSVTVDGKHRVIEEVGDCERPDNWPHDGARLKDAMSDALKRCCPHTGLGLHLYCQEAYVLYRLLSAKEEPAVEDTADVAEFDPDDPGRPM